MGALGAHSSEHVSHLVPRFGERAEVAVAPRGRECATAQGEDSNAHWPKRTQLVPQLGMVSVVLRQRGGSCSLCVHFTLVICADEAVHPHLMNHHKITLAFLRHEQ